MIKLFVDMVIDIYIYIYSFVGSGITKLIFEALKATLIQSNFFLMKVILSFMQQNEYIEDFY